MTPILDFSKVIPAESLQGDDPEDTRLLQQMLVDASQYLLNFSWYNSIEKVYFGLGVGGIVAVFLFQIRPAHQGVDDWLWVIVGDLPSAYLTTESCPNPATALDAYIGAMTEWVIAAKAGKSVKELIPVNVEATLENAKHLESRLQFLDQEILREYANDLKRS